MQDVAAKALALRELLALLQMSPHLNESQLSASNEIARLIIVAEAVADEGVRFFSWRRFADLVVHSGSPGRSRTT
jgi:hypothetical protein